MAGKMIALWQEMTREIKQTSITNSMAARYTDSLKHVKNVKTVPNVS